MKYQAEINVMPLKELLDPQGKAIQSGLKNLQFKSIDNVRIGKRITMELEANDQNEANQKTKSVCEKVLANPVMEYFEFSLTQI